MAKIAIFLLVVAVSASSWAGTKAQSNDGCSGVIVSLSPCLDYVTGKETTPASACCSSLETVVATKPQCLCEVINGTATSSLGISIDQTRALQLPAACNVQTPPASRCNGSPSPSPSPEHPAGSGSNGTTAAKSHASASYAKLVQSSSSLLIVLFIASFIFIY